MRQKTGENAFWKSVKNVNFTRRSKAMWKLRIGSASAFDLLHELVDGGVKHKIGEKLGFDHVYIGVDRGVVAVEYGADLGNA